MSWRQEEEEEKKSNRSTRMPTHNQVVFRSTQLCALQSSEMILGPLLTGFDGSNTPLTSASFYLPTKTPTEGCFTVIGQLKCTCLVCAATHTNTHSGTIKDILCSFFGKAEGMEELLLARQKKKKIWLPNKRQNTLKVFGGLYIWNNINNNKKGMNLCDIFIYWHENVKWLLAQPLMFCPEHASFT